MVSSSAATTARPRSTNGRMRHQRAGKKLGRDAAHRKALYSNLTGALIEHGRIKTTVTKAKAVKPVAEQMITLARRGDLHARRQAVAFLRSKDVVHKLFTDVGPRFKDRPGGYSRIVKIGPRPGDAAEMAYLELVEAEVVAQPRRDRRGAAPGGAGALAAPALEGAPRARAAAVPGPTVEEPPETEEELVEDPAEPDEVAVAEGEPGVEDEAEPT